MPRKERIVLNIEPSDVDARITAIKENPERVLIRLISSISRGAIMYAGTSITRYNLSVSQAVILVELLQHDGCSQDDLRARVKLDKGNITRAVQRLEENGFVFRKQDTVDRRAMRVFVSKKACSIERELYTLALFWDNELTRGFTREEREKLISLLLRMEANAEALIKEEKAESENTRP